MTALELFDLVEADDNLVGRTRNSGTPEMEAVIYNKRMKLDTRIPLKSLEGLSWEKHVRPVLYGEREPNPLFSMTRVVGYYSRTDNWNASKLGELHDRHIGTYALPETAVPA